MSAANTRQVGGSHYASPYQHWDFVHDAKLDYFQAQVTKYVYRWRKKNGTEDLSKAAHVLQKYIELRGLRGYVRSMWDTLWRAGVCGYRRFTLAEKFIAENSVGDAEAAIIINVSVGDGASLRLAADVLGLLLSYELQSNACGSDATSRYVNQDVGAGRS